MCKGAYGKTLTGLDWSDKTWTGVVKTCRARQESFLPFQQERYYA